MSINNVNGNIGGVAGAQGITSTETTTGKLSVADRVALVMLEKSEILQGQLESYINQVSEKNEKLKQLGEIQSKLRNMGNTTNTVDSPTWTADHSASPKQIDLDNGYSILIHGESQAWTIQDANGNETKIWGDPHVNEGDKAGEKNWDFHEDATFVLDDGTKIHVTVKDIGEQGLVTDKLTITKGNQSLEVSDIAIDAPQVGNPELRGGELDQATNDGYVFMMGDQADDWIHMQGDTSREIGSDGWENITTGGAVQHEGGSDMTGGGIITAPDAGPGTGPGSSNDINNTLTASDLALLKELGVEIFDSSGTGQLSPTEIQNLNMTIKSAQESLTSVSQIDMVKLQAANSKYEQTNALASQVMKSQFQETKSIIRNIG
ncbi:MAG: DUF1521 domain-containing protein [Endozoicomonadaceae bacterium]|nr:DUF1521 domain-containing protein [Endozoicomonadaceae bacterium]MCY4328681.1 DUF1521 domain-containing protein [Endozoicomonadaceae bacterium]